MANRPILANSCARAATAHEARFRVEILPRTSWRSARVIALDAKSLPIVRNVAGLPWWGARFFTTASGNDLQTIDGHRVRLSDELDNGADLVVMVASAGDGAASAADIGLACTERGIMTAGLITDGGAELDDVVSALRPYARVLMVTRDEQDIAEVLTALRA
jgi:hypothetical protein